MKTIRIYSDESRHRDERFLLLGGLWIEEENVQTVELKIAEFRKSHGYEDSSGKHIDFLGEFKWTKVSDKYFEVYKSLVDLFFQWIDSDTFRFCSILIDSHDPIVVQFSNIKKDGYFKILYQLYLHNSRTPAYYKIFPDRITNPDQHKVNFETLEKCLDVAFHGKFAPLLNPGEMPGTFSGFVNNITPIDSKQSQFIQLIDVIIGALGYLQNGVFRKAGAKKAKVELMKCIFEKIALSGAIKIEGKKFYIAKSTKFNIWKFRPRNKKSPF